jgi:hypothetical protein
MAHDEWERFRSKSESSRDLCERVPT